jgi:hypothetical protein
MQKLNKTASSASESAAFNFVVEVFGKEIGGKEKDRQKDEPRK